MDDDYREPDRAWTELLGRAFVLAAEYGDECRPVHVLAAFSELEGPIGVALAPAAGGRLVPRPVDPIPARGGSSGFLVDQTQELSQLIAKSLDQVPTAGHLFLAVLDQGEPEAMATLQGAGLEILSVRFAALAGLGLPSDFAPLATPPLAAAGTMGRSPLPVEELDRSVWQVLRWRQEHLPLGRVRSESAWHALRALENTAAWKLADQAGLSDDQRYSVYFQHANEVERRANAVKPDIVRMRPHREPGRSSPGQGLYGRGQRTRWQRVAPTFMIGWPTWFGNRQVGLRNLRFRLMTWGVYRGQPRLGTSAPG